MTIRNYEIKVFALALINCLGTIEMSTAADKLSYKSLGKMFKKSEVPEVEKEVTVYMGTCYSLKNIKDTTMAYSYSVDGVQYFVTFSVDSDSLMEKKIEEIESEMTVLRMQIEEALLTGADVSGLKSSYRKLNERAKTLDGEVDVVKDDTRREPATWIDDSFVGWNWTSPMRPPFSYPSYPMALRYNSKEKVFLIENGTTASQRYWETYKNGSYLSRCYMPYFFQKDFLVE